MKKKLSFAYQVCLLFSFLGALFIPFSFDFLSFQSKITKIIFEKTISKIAVYFNLQSYFFEIKNPEITSDSASFYLLFVMLFFIALVLNILLLYFLKSKTDFEKLQKFIQLFLTYYLALIMLKYGLSKFFETQFYLPEPNILYTPVGMLDKDILFWTTMSTSKLYTIFLGFIEVVPAMLLCYYRTRILGLLMLLGVLISVVFINLGFDISVKSYSMFLFFLCFVLVVPSLKQLVRFFILHKPTVLLVLSGQDLVASKAIRLGFKTILICFFFTETLYPHLQNKYDKSNPHNELVGAYRVFKIEKTKKNAPNFDLKRIFIHKDYYFIVQFKDESIEDFSLKITPTQHKCEITNYEGQKITFFYQYLKKTKILKLSATQLGIIIYAQALPWKNLPVLKPLFHWTVDEI
jgi:hypothetical protein